MNVNITSRWIPRRKAPTLSEMTANKRLANSLDIDSDAHKVGCEFGDRVELSPGERDGASAAKSLGRSRETVHALADVHQTLLNLSDALSIGSAADENISSSC